MPGPPRAGPGATSRVERNPPCRPPISPRNAAACSPCWDRRRRSRTRRTRLRDARRGRVRHRPGGAGRAEDELALHRLLDTYLFAVDTKDKTLFRTLFTDDAALTVMARPDGTGGIVKSGIEAVVANLDGAAAWGCSTHVTANAHLRVTARHTATGDSHATAQLVHPATATAPETVVVRGIRYRDEYARSAGAWRIRKRVFSPLWQYNATAIPLTYPN